MNFEQLIMNFKLDYETCLKVMQVRSITERELNATLAQFCQRRELPFVQFFERRPLYYPRELSAGYHLTHSMDKVRKIAQIANDIHKGEVFLDLGANVGQVSFFLDKSFDNLTLAVEPTKDLHPYIEANCPNVHVMKAAVTDIDGPTVFFTNSDSFQTSSLFEENIIDQTKTVSSSTVDGLSIESIIQYVDTRVSDDKSDLIVKLDIQGGEASCAARLSRMKERVRAIFLECTFLDPESLINLREICELLGFKYVGVVNDVTLGADLFLSRKPIENNGLFRRILNLDNLKTSHAYLAQQMVDGPSVEAREQTVSWNSECSSGIGVETPAGAFGKGLRL